MLKEGAPIFTEGPELSTMNAADGPAAGARLPPLEALPAAMLMATVPSPVQVNNVTVRVVFPDPLTPFKQFAVPVVMRVMSALLSVIALAFV